MMDRITRFTVGRTRIVALLSIFTMISFASAQAASYKVRKNLVKASDVRASNDYAFDNCRAIQAKPFDISSDKKKIIILGDSQGCDFLNGLVENHYLRDYQIRFRFIPYPCQRVPGDHVSKYVKRRHQHFCLQSDRADSLQNARRQIQQADVIIFSALWKPEVAKKLPQIMDYLKIKKQQEPIVIGNKFFGHMDIHDYIHMTDRELRLLRVDVGEKSALINNILRKSIGNNTTFVDPQKLVCGDDGTCPVFTNDLRLISYDGRHLTRDGARYIGKIIYQRSALHDIFN